MNTEDICSPNANLRRLHTYIDESGVKGPIPIIQGEIYGLGVKVSGSFWKFIRAMFWHKYVIQRAAILSRLPWWMFSKKYRDSLR